ncbi:MAG: phosphate transport system permease protein [Candidatus Azotimanducaceae bacterium]|jgi:phosphate transport system permease protein
MQTTRQTTGQITGQITMQKFFRSWFASGEPWIWMNAAAVGISVIAVVGILGLIAVKGFGHFWPTPVSLFEVETSQGGVLQVYGELVQTESLPLEQFLESDGATGHVSDERNTIERWLVKTGNRRQNPPDFRWLYAHDVLSSQTPKEVIAIERIEWGNAYGVATKLVIDSTGETLTEPLLVQNTLDQRITRANDLRDQISAIENGSLNRINYELERLRLTQRKLEINHQGNSQQARLLAEQEQDLRAAYEIDETELRALYDDLNQDTLVIATADGSIIDIPVADILHAWYPNQFGSVDKVVHFTSAIWRFLSEDPREANTEGGIFPAIFGTVLMVLLMSVMVTPFGVLAAVYLREYAKQGIFVRIIRIAVNNLAGVPSIVYGVFGLGFFVYFLGGNLDQLFYPEALPAPTFGTPGLVWASLTLALLTVPVVIVSTEEGLTRIPRSLREGSLALGATKSETLFRIILPMASPSILTGVILAVARAAGEVAPLMLVGVVKLAPTLPLDGNFPYLHLERKFMHLGFHIYDVGFQSPNVEAARPLVYATALLLVIIIVVLNLTAITLRSRLENRYRGVES